MDNGCSMDNGSAAYGGADTGDQRVLVLSPHPDDDVISMGGTLARLCQKGLEVCVLRAVS
jgi:glucosamine-6-phosphate deaminase